MGRGVNMRDANTKRRTGSDGKAERGGTMSSYKEREKKKEKINRKR